MAKRALSARRFAAMNSFVSMVVDAMFVLVVLVAADVRVIKEEEGKRIVAYLIS